MDATLAVAGLALIASQSSAKASAPAPTTTTPAPVSPVAPPQPDAPLPTGPQWVLVVQRMGPLRGYEVVVADGWEAATRGLPELVARSSDAMPDSTGRLVAGFEGTNDGETVRIRPVYEDGTRGAVARFYDVASGAIVDVTPTGLTNVVVVDADPGATMTRDEPPPGVVAAGLVPSRITSTNGRTVRVWFSRELSAGEAARVRAVLERAGLPAELVWSTGIPSIYADPEPEQPGAPVPYVPSSNGGGVTMPPTDNNLTPRPGDPNGVPPPNPILPASDDDAVPTVIFGEVPRAASNLVPGGAGALTYNTNLLSGRRYLP